MSFVYLEIDVSILPIQPWRSIMIAQMGEIDFESFVDTDKGFKAYLPEHNFSKEDFEGLPVFSQQHLSIKWFIKTIPPQNWNASWEKDFKPIRVSEDCLVRATFHPYQGVKYELIITPKMSFGTGHHETTQLMLLHLLELDCKGKKFLDMGTGTGVLAIMAEKKGARSVHAIDIDPWCVENAHENVSLNSCRNITVELNSQAPNVGTYDIILANINRNILLEQLPIYADRTSEGGSLLMSGFYVDDLVKIQNRCEDIGFEFIRKFIRKDWIALEFTKR